MVRRARRASGPARAWRSGARTHGQLSVREALRGRDVGTACLAWLEDVCRAEGVHAPHLEVDRTTERAKRLYRRRGYGNHDRQLLTKWL